MKREAAEKVVNAFMLVYEAMGNADLAISEVDTQEERSYLIRALGSIVRITREDVPIPIFAEHPSLIPPELNKGQGS